MKHFLLYSSLRLLLLVAVGGLAFAIGLRGLLLIVVAFIVSGLLSLFVLRGPREQFGTDVGGFFTRINERIDAATAAEDFDPPESQPPARSGSEAGVGVQTAEDQVNPEVVEPEHHKS